MPSLWSFLITPWISSTVIGVSRTKSSSVIEHLWWRSIFDWRCWRDRDSETLDLLRHSKWVDQAAIISFWDVNISPFNSSLDPLGLPSRGVRKRDFAHSLNFSSTNSDCRRSFLALSSLILFLTSFLVVFFFSNSSPDVGLPASHQSIQADLLILQSCFSCSSLKKLQWRLSLLEYFGRRLLARLQISLHT